MRPRYRQAMRRPLPRSAWLLTAALLATAAAAPAREHGPSLVHPRPTSSPRHRPSSVARSDDGLFRVVARINGAPVVLVVDTGANTVVLSPADARRAGIGARMGRPDRLETAAGPVAAARVTLDRMVIGDRLLRRADAVVAPGATTSLLGQDALAAMGTVTLRGGRLEWD